MIGTLMPPLGKRTVSLLLLTSLLGVLTVVANRWKAADYPSEARQLELELRDAISQVQVGDYSQYGRFQRHPLLSTPKRSNRRPPILIILIDDLGYADLGFKGSGISTPNIDELARKGTILHNFYTLSACTLTRIALLTGKYPYRSGIYKIINIHKDTGMSPRDETIAQVLRRRGYQAHAIGKWHLGHAWNDYLPTFRGFQSFFGFWGGQMDYYSHAEPPAYDMRYDRHEFCQVHPNCSTYPPHVRGKYSTTVFNNRALQLIQNFNPSNGPLFLYLAHQGIHAPYQVPPKYRRPYEPRKRWSPIRKSYAGMLTAVDEGLGEIVRALKDQDMWDDTLVILSMDNGAPTGQNQGGSNDPLRGMKWSIFDGGIRADGIVGGPARAKLGFRKGVNFYLFHAVDWLPTLADIVGAKARPNLDGVSQVRSLRGQGTARTSLYLGYSYKDRRVAAYRTRDLKLIRWTPSNYSLYNLTHDVSERHNLLQPGRYNNRTIHVDNALLQGMKRKLNSYDGQFRNKPRSLGPCGKKRFGRTPWNGLVLIPWCEGAQTG